MNIVSCVLQILPDALIILLSPESPSRPKFKYFICRFYYNGGKKIKVLICTDGSKFAEEAIDQAGYLLKHTGPEVTVLRVIPDFEKKYEEYNEYFELFKDDIHRLRKLGTPKAVSKSLETGVKILENYGIKAGTKVRKGRVADEIMKETEEGNYNLVVLASYGSGISKFMLGSVSREVVHRSEIPVLVVKSGAGKNMF
ncbi:MAG TPA: universal stress protein [Euryarchaeota archaeon]|nr:universal stress protein family protein [archaeon BMS3Bbin15]HDL15618.1 universal stress protein [Euryarchaeota archaeon]